MSNCNFVAEDRGLIKAQKMKIHLAERDPQHHALPKRGVEKKNLKLRILLSYHYYKKTNLDELFAKYFDKPYPDVFADSGAFSAMTQGVPINLEDYAAWVKRWKHLFTVYANLDVIGDSSQTMKNQRRLEAMGLNPLPVFHTGSDYSELERLVNEYQYIALGGLVSFLKQRKLAMRHLIKCFSIAGDRAVFHGFGVTSWYAISNLPWYSCDSSSWGSGFRFGTVPLFDNQKGKFNNVNLGDVKAWQKQKNLVTRLGFNWRDFAYRSRNDRAKIAAISALSYMLAEQHLRKVHGRIRIPKTQDKTDGVQVYLADANCMKDVISIRKGLVK